MDYIVTRVGDDNDYISHHGVLGMRWGYRKAEVSSPRRIGENGNNPSRKKLMKMEKTADRTNRQKVINTGIETLENTEVGKKYNESLIDMNKLNKQGIILVGEIPGEREYINEARKYANSHKQEWASATLKDLGYEDTIAGREYLLKKGVMNWG